MLINISEEEALERLMDRVHYWTEDKDELNLYEQMYSNYIYGGIFDEGDFNVDVIVDNDYINWCSTVGDDEEEFNDILKVFKEQGLGDCSCEHCRGNFIEAVDNDDKPTLFLIRE